MNNCCMFRRIDELGRIVIPVEIRKILNIKYGDNLEFLLNDNKIILRKRSISQSNLDLLVELGKTLSSVINSNFLITDREKVLISSNNSIINEKLDSTILDLLVLREEFFVVDNSLLVKDKKLYVYPYISDNNIIGFIILYDITDWSKYFLLIKFISNYINDRLSIS